MKHSIWIKKLKKFSKSQIKLGNELISDTQITLDGFLKHYLKNNNVEVAFLNCNVFSVYLNTPHKDKLYICKFIHTDKGFTTNLQAEGGMCSRSSSNDRIIIAGQILNSDFMKKGDVIMKNYMIQLKVLSESNYKAITLIRLYSKNKLRIINK